jgi:hypothetical protein
MCNRVNISTSPSLYASAILRGAIWRWRGSVNSKTIALRSESAHQKNLDALCASIRFLAFLNRGYPPCLECGFVIAYGSRSHDMPIPLQTEHDWTIHSINLFHGGCGDKFWRRLQMLASSSNTACLARLTCSLLDRGIGCLCLVPRVLPF